MTKQPTDGLDYNTYFYDPLVSWLLWRNNVGTLDEAGGTEGGVESFLV